MQHGLGTQNGKQEKGKGNREGRKRRRGQSKGNKLIRRAATRGNNKVWQERQSKVKKGRPEEWGACTGQVWQPGN